MIAVYNDSSSQISSITYNGGVDIKITSSLLGHASRQIMDMVYATLLPNTIAERVGDKLNVKLD